jgi:hypothetical protein
LGVTLAAAGHPDGKPPCSGLGYRDKQGLGDPQHHLITLKRHTGSPDAEAFIHLALEADGKIKGKEKYLG